MEIKKIYLIGFMGSGKSTVGKELAKNLNQNFIDLDCYIEKKHHMKIKDIFSKLGENTFRKYETICLKEAQNYGVIATGGGIVERKENILVMKEGLIIFLDASFEEITKRLQGDTKRPLWKQSKERQVELYKRRKQLYMACSHWTINTTNCSISDVVNIITKKVMNNNN